MNSFGGSSGFGGWFGIFVIVRVKESFIVGIIVGIFFFFTYSRARENQIRERMVKVLDTSVAFFMMIWVEDGVSIKLSNPSASLGNGILFVPL